MLTPLSPGHRCCVMPAAVTIISAGTLTSLLWDVPCPSGDPSPQECLFQLILGICKKQPKEVKSPVALVYIPFCYKEV